MDSLGSQAKVHMTNGNKCERKEKVMKNRINIWYDISTLELRSKSRPLVIGVSEDTRPTGR
jgi:hypothetical protein